MLHFRLSHPPTSAEAASSASALNCAAYKRGVVTQYASLPQVFWGVKLVVLVAALFIFGQAIAGRRDQLLTSAKWSLISSYECSPDNRHIAYVIDKDLYIDAEKVQSWNTICPGTLEWSANGSTVAFWAFRDGNWRIVRYNVASKSTSEFGSFQILERRTSSGVELMAGRGATIQLSNGALITVQIDTQGSDRWMAFPSSRSRNFKSLRARATFAVAPDGSRVAHTLFDGGWRMFDSGDSLSKAESWDEILSYFEFSPDGTRLAYVGLKDWLWTVVIDSTKSPGWDSVTFPSFSGNSKHYAYVGVQETKSYLVVDGHRDEILSTTELGSVALSNDSRFVLWAQKTDGRWWLYSRKTAAPPPRDNAQPKRRKQRAVRTIPMMPPKPDVQPPEKVGVEELRLHSFDGIDNVTLHESGRFAWVAREGKLYYVIDGTRPSTSYRFSGKPVFSPDGKHLAYRVKTLQDKLAVVVDGIMGPEFTDVLSDPVFDGNDRLRYVVIERPDGPILVVEPKVSSP